jgi:HAD superfamily hydrolase (TIGR01549 family)
MTPAAILDVDGTLVDTNYHHAIAWYRAFRKSGVTPEIWRIHRHIGMGGDQLVGAVAGDDVEGRVGDEIREAEGEIYMSMIEEVEPFDGARELIAELREMSDAVVLASSAKEHEVDHYLDLLDAREIATDWTTSADVEATKPQPDLVRAAMDKAGTDSALMIGDTTWDCEAAGRAGIQAVAVLTGGFAASELREAGAVAVYTGLADMREKLGELPVIGRAQAGATSDQG